mmetsp:Transcript_20646/g.30761  ORF Transcript_20646/g.30761 Transcript_20646/m.30761 type:complete len:246 (-) Transcript_20646:124-861(-)
MQPQPPHLPRPRPPSLPAAVVAAAREAAVAVLQQAGEEAAVLVGMESLPPPPLRCLELGWETIQPHQVVVQGLLQPGRRKRASTSGMCKESGRPQPRGRRPKLVSCPSTPAVSCGPQRPTPLATGFSPRRWRHPTTTPSRRKKLGFHTVSFVELPSRPADLSTVWDRSRACRSRSVTTSTSITAKRAVGRLGLALSSERMATVRRWRGAGSLRVASGNLFHLPHEQTTLYTRRFHYSSSCLRTAS